MLPMTGQPLGPGEDGSYEGLAAIICIELARPVKISVGIGCL
jgi:hypothetical protein